jgi:hypothetical protein
LPRTAQPRRKGMEPPSPRAPDLAAAPTRSPPQRRCWAWTRRRCCRRWPHARA